ncbi:MAG: endonuclease/exonuclease/phosphatase family protein [Anaerolineae bacterium]|nr:endonuclease/exonuclease/phosphatase family protein [Anaerolineae bacterium]
MQVTQEPVAQRTLSLQNLGRQWLRSVRLQIGAVAGTYGLLTALYLGARALVGERWVVIALLNNGAHWILLGAVASFVLAFLSPYRRFWVIYALPGFIMFWVWFGALFSPWRLSNTDQGTGLVVATFNIKSEDTVIEKRLAVVRDLDADIIGLQELSGAEVIAELKRLYPYHVIGLEIQTDQQTVNESGLGIFSRYPIDESETYLIGNKPERQHPVALRTVITNDQKSISVYVMHPLRPTITIRPAEYNGSERHDGIQDAMGFIHQEQNPVVILCDCNLSSATEDYSLLAGSLVDSWQDAGFGFGLTAPSDNNDTPFMLMRSDYVWHSPDMDTISVTVWPDSGGSDHRPVRAQLGF